MDQVEWPRGRQHGANHDVCEREKSQHVPSEASLMPNRPRVDTQAIRGADAPIKMSTFAPAKVSILGTRPSIQS
jgi:hypothetical protein